MNQAFPTLKTRSQRTAAHRALANHVGNAEQLESSDLTKSLQVSRLQAVMQVSEETARTLARLVYGEGRSS